MYLSFRKEESNLIKGIAILMMIILHCYTVSYWPLNYFNELSNTHVVRFMGSLKLCVGIYTFLVGYGYAFSKSKDWKYSVAHIIKLIIPFWIIVFVFILPFYINEFDITLFLKNLFGINSQLNYFSWFVAFFIYAMIIMPFVAKFINSHPIRNTIISIIFFYTLEVLLHKFYLADSEEDFSQRFFDCLGQTPTMILGFLFSYKHFFEKIEIRNISILRLFSVFLLVFILFLRFNIQHFYGFNFDFFYAPIFIFCLLLIFSVNHPAFYFLKKGLMSLGKNSVYMWFFHALFFTTVVRYIYQPLVLISNNFYLVVLWVVVFTYLCSVILNKLIGSYVARLTRRICP